MIERRELLATTAAATAGLIATNLSRADHHEGTGSQSFKLNYAPHFGMFKHSAGDDLVAQLEFAADQGFTAWEDNGMMGRSAEEQNRIAKAMERLGIKMGVFVATATFSGVTFADPDKDTQAKILEGIRKSVDVAKRVNATWMTVVPGLYDKKLEWDYQTANCVELLRRCSDILEPHGLVMVLEPLNWRRDHAGVFLTKVPQAYLICRAVNSPACKILDDLYHQQITEGNLIPNIDRAYDEIAYFQVGDHPGRKEPGTGEINYQNVFRHIHEKGYQGIVGMEHGNSQSGKAGEQAVIDAYRKADDF